MKQRAWEITTERGPFAFVADSKVLAHDHAMMLRDDPSFVKEYGQVLVSSNVNEKVRAISVRMVGWA